MLNIFLQKTNKVKLLFSLIKGVKNVSIYGVLCEGKKDKEEMKETKMKPNKGTTRSKRTRVKIQLRQSLMKHKAVFPKQLLVANDCSDDQSAQSNN